MNDLEIKQFIQLENHILTQLIVQLNNYKNKMGNKNLSPQSNEYQTLLKDYTIIQSDKKDIISYLQHRQTKQEYLLRHFNYSDQEIYVKELQNLRRRAQVLIDNQHLVRVQKIMEQKCQQYCMTLYKIYVVLEYPHRTLAHEIEQRRRRRLQFNEKEIWSILASCILGLSHLQKHKIMHSTLTTNNILLTSDGLVKLFDPHIINQRSNYLTVYQQRSSKNIYISPEQLHKINENESSPDYNTFKSDIWVLGLIILETGLLKSMSECYRTEYTDINWQNLNINMKAFKNTYSSELTNFIELMLIKQDKQRPTFLQLQKIMTNEQESKSCILNEIKSYEDLFIESKCTDNKKTQHSFIPTQTIISQRPIEVYNPMFSIDQSLVRAKNQSSINQSIVVSIIAQSNITNTRPMRSIFPMNCYRTYTVIDQNVKVVQQEELSEGDGSLSHSKVKVNEIIHDNMKSWQVQNIRRQEEYYRDNNQFKIQAYDNSNSKDLNVIYEINSKEDLTVRQKSKDKAQQSRIAMINGSTNPLEHSTEYIVQHYKQGSKYQGYKLNKLKHGTGIYSYQQGGRYQGQWFMDKMQGNGKLYYQSGKLAYEGQWYNDKFLGKGVLYNDTPQILKGSFDYNNFDEIEEYWVKYQGTCFRYLGQFIDDMKNGWGMLYLTNGEMFQGKFQNDFIHGQGCYHMLNGGKVKGYWDTNLKI